MITAIVTFELPAGATLEKARAAFQESAPKYQGVKGLVRKYYLFDPETNVAGGVYLWQSRADAEAVYNDEWRAALRERYGADPSVRYFESPVIVDNDTGAIDVAAE